ncbi:MAG: AEC family transporter [Pseudomonadota bacterium]|nr:AEC family transporter [Pseudomonadota bacterium]
MLNVINITIPFFSLIFFGTFLNHIGFFKNKEERLLAKTAFFVFMPAMIYYKIASTPAINFLNIDFILLYEVSTVVIFLLAYPIGKLFKLELDAIGIFGLCSAYPNYGYIGIPMALIAFGDGAAAPIALIIFANTLTLILMTSLYVSFHRGQSSSGATVKLLLKTVISNPIILAVTGGMLSAILGLKLPSVVNSSLFLMAGAAAPVALVALGASLSFGLLHTAMVQIFSISLMKLLIHPFLVFIVFYLWSTEERVWVQTALLCASLPVAANVYMLASHFNAHVTESANAIVVSTLLSTISIPAILFFLL